MRRTRITATIVAIATLMALAVPALAAEPASDGGTGHLKERALAAIDRRLETVDALRSAVLANPHVTAPHQATLLGDLGRDQGGLTALRAQIEREENRAALAEMAASIVIDFRIYVVERPRVIGVLASDTGVAFADRGRERLSLLDEHIERARAAGFDVSAASALAQEARGHLDELEALAGPVAGVLLPLDASDWPDPARQVIVDARADLADARVAAHEAVSAARAAVQALRAAIGRAA